MRRSVSSTFLTGDTKTSKKISYIEQKHLKIPTGGRLTSWLFTWQGVESGAAKHKSILWQGEGFELRTSRSQTHV